MTVDSLTYVYCSPVITIGWVKWLPTPRQDFTWEQHSSLWLELTSSCSEHFLVVFYRWPPLTQYRFSLPDFDAQQAERLTEGLGRAFKRRHLRTRLRVPLNEVDNLEPDFHHDERDDHPLEPHVVLVRQAGGQHVRQLHTVVQLLIHHLGGGRGNEMCQSKWDT